MPIIPEEFFVSRWNWLSKIRSQPKDKQKEIDIYVKETQNAFQMQEEQTPQEQQHETPITDCKDVLYSSEETQKKQQAETTPTFQRKTWENIDLIEEHIDTTSEKKSKETCTKQGDKTIEEKVDRVLEHKKKKTKK